MLAAELERVLRLELDPAKTMLGINNRDLGTFRVDISNNQRIMDSAAGQQVRMQCSRHSCGMYYSRQGFLLLNAVGNSAFWHGEAGACRPWDLVHGINDLLAGRP